MNLTASLPAMDYQQALQYIYSFTNFEVTPARTYASKTFDLTRMERLLHALDNPRQAPSVHVAGTKGKGSTAAMIESVLRAAGHFTGFYTSPHLHTFRERIRVGREMISRADVVAGAERLKPLVEQVPGITAFELMTALAFDYFARRNVEIAVLEVGLGGRLDATNVIVPQVSVITSISFDHVAILGNTLGAIAREKAGIIKPGIPVISSPQQDEARTVIQDVARVQNAPLISIWPDLHFEVLRARYQLVAVKSGLESQRAQLMNVNQPSKQGLIIDLPLLGQHQLANATTALASLFTLRAQGIDIPDSAIRTGLANVEWPARFEVLQHDPVIVVDGAHNAGSAQQLVATLDEIFPGARVHFIFGASNDKDIAGMFGHLLPRAESLILTRSQNPRAADPARLAELAATQSVYTATSPDLVAALQHARQRARPDDVICVTGSLFVAAEARQTVIEQRGGRVELDV